MHRLNDQIRTSLEVGFADDDAVGDALKVGLAPTDAAKRRIRDRLLALMTKGITLASSRKVLAAFRVAGIMVHAYLMYGFPTQTEDEAFAALDWVRGLFRDDLIQSAFYHRFALTVHSPVAADPERFGIVPDDDPRPGPHGRFCRNEIGYREPGAPDWGAIGRRLELALYNYMEGRALSRRAAYWRKLKLEAK